MSGKLEQHQRVLFTKTLVSLSKLNFWPWTRVWPRFAFLSRSSWVSFVCAHPGLHKIKQLRGRHLLGLLPRTATDLGNSRGVDRDCSSLEVPWANYDDEAISFQLRRAYLQRNTAGGLVYIDIKSA